MANPWRSATPLPIRVTVLGPDDLVRLAFDDNLDLPADALRKRIQRARKALEVLEHAGAVAVERDEPGGVRILEPRRSRR